RSQESKHLVLASAEAQRCLIFFQGRTGKIKERKHMKTFQKRSFPVDQTRRYLEPGPIVLVSSHWQGESNIMTMGWHMMLEYDRIGCYIWDENHSFDLIRKSKQCVINLPRKFKPQNLAGATLPRRCP